MANTIFVLGIVTLVVLGCNDTNENPETSSQGCDNNAEVAAINQRNFKLGFSTWSHGPDLEDKNETYQFIESWADIYSEHIDNKIPWDAWINNTSLPSAFVNEIDDRASRKIDGRQLLLSVSLLNLDRNDLSEDYDGSIPDYTVLNDATIEDAYFKHLDYLVTKLNPDYLVMAMEVNELKKSSETKWQEYKLLMESLRARLKEEYPGLPLSESVTLHNWFMPDVSDPKNFIADISSYVNQQLDFAAISYYPFFKGQHTASEFQQAFDFLHQETDIPISFVETSHIAVNLEIAGLNLNIPGDVCGQKAYLETIFLNANRENYRFIIWWAHRDFDELWETFPAEVKDLGKIWRDTGLLDENGDERPGFAVWKRLYNK